MGSEQNMRSRVVGMLKCLAAMAVENGCLPGTPDVAHTAGWLELKVLKEWPRDPDAVVRFPLVRPEQRIWWRRWAKAGGRVQVLIQIGHHEWLLLEGGWAADHLGLATRNELIANAVGRWGRGIDEKELARCVSGS